MLYDLNISWSENQDPQILQRTISFLSELGYNTLALNHTITGSLPSQITNPIPAKQSFPVPGKTTLLRRCTLHVSDPSLNHRLPALASTYDILALRPTTEKAFLAACTTLTEHSLISLDLTQRFPFHFRPKPFMTAINRGIRFEICYAQSTMGDATARRNFISGVLGILRATRGRGIVVSSEAGSILGARAPADVVNLLSVWGMGRERALEGLGVNPRAVVVNEGLKRSGFRGVLDVIDGGEMATIQKDVEMENSKENGKKGTDLGVTTNKNKRKADTKRATGDTTPQISKRQAKKLKMEALKAGEDGSSPEKAPPPSKVALSDSRTPTTTKSKANG